MVVPLSFAPAPLVAGVPLVGAAPLTAVPLAAPLAAPLTALPPLVEGGGLTALLKLAAVGLLSRSNTLGPAVGLRTGVGGGDAALRALASEAAVGAKRPEAGVFGRAGV